jgi:hypothetical protein
MSQENVELVRAGYEEFNKTGQPPMQIYDPAIECPVWGLGRRPGTP